MNYLILFGLLLSNFAFAESIYFPNSYFKKDEQVLDYVIENYISPNAIEAPGNVEDFKIKLKEWNPKITDWTRIREGVNVNVLQKSPLYDLSLGFNTFSNKEKLDGGQNIATSTLSQILSLQISFFHRIRISSFLKMIYEYQNNYTVAETNTAYTYPASYNAEFGIFYSKPKSRWSFNGSIENEKTSFLTFDSSKYIYFDEIIANLQVASYTLYWLNIGFKYRIPTDYRGFYLVMNAGQSVIGNRKFSDGSMNESVSAQKIKGGLKYYFLGKMWIEGFSQYLLLKTSTSATSLQYGLHTGYTF